MGRCPRPPNALRLCPRPPSPQHGVAVVALHSALVGPCEVVWCPVLLPMGLTLLCRNLQEREGKEESLEGYGTGGAENKH